MAVMRSSFGVSLAVACFLALPGCVDMFTASTAPEIGRWRGETRPAPAGEAIVWQGISSPGDTRAGGCGPLAFDVAIHRDPISIPLPVSGRAAAADAPGGTAERLSRALTTWWVEGYQNPDGFVQIESKLQRPAFFRARPYSVWRGVAADDRIALIESGSPCGRELVLTRRGDRVAGLP